MGMSTQSPSTLNENLSWDFNAYNVRDEDVNADHEILTALVRSSYLRHLQRSLSNNYELWFEKNQDNEDLNEVSPNDIINCANFLEHKALRACMVTSYYQRAMVKTMKEIKQSTEEGSLFSPLIEQLFDNRCTNSKKMCDRETQTNISLITCKTNECSQSNQEKEKQLPPQVELSTENSNLIVINPRDDIAAEQEKADAIEDLFNILMHSPSYSDGDPFQSPKNQKINDSSLPYCDTELDACDVDLIDHPTPFETSLPHSQKSNLHYIKAKPKEYASKLSNDNPYGNFSGSNSMTLPRTEPEIGPPEPKKSNLDERLKSLAALFGEDEEEEADINVISEQSRDDISDMSDENSVRPKTFKLALDWRTEYAAQMCNLKMALSRMSSHKRHRLRKRFRELFGSDSGSVHTFISVNEEALSRKRTANIVVGELTPHYIAGRIASREVFKALAKKITDELLLLPYVAGPEEISKKVNSFFRNGNCINSVKDIDDVLISYL